MSSICNRLQAVSSNIIERYIFFQLEADSTEQKYQQFSPCISCYDTSTAKKIIDRPIGFGFSFKYVNLHTLI